MDRGYRKVLYQWLYARNRMWVQSKESDEGGYEDLGTSRNVFNKEVNRQERCRITNTKRGADPLKRESRIVRWAEDCQPDEVLVSLLLSTCSTYQIKDDVVEENVSESVAIHLLLIDKAWKIHHISYLPQSVIEGSHNRVVTSSSEVNLSTRTHKYDRKKAVAYAEKYWNIHNPKYRYFGENDCTNFISQCLLAGGISIDLKPSRSQGWWYKHAKDGWSYSWTVAHSFALYLKKKEKPPIVTQMTSASDLEIGDIICYDWDGGGRWAHNTIVTKIDPNHEPLVNAHAVDSQHRFWEYTDSEAYQKGKTKYAFFHIIY